MRRSQKGICATRFSILLLLALVAGLQACGGSGSAPAYSLGGGVSGLRGSGLIVADGARTVAVAPGASSFVFPTPLTTGSSYSVTIASQPAGQICEVTDASGVIASAAVSVKIGCSGPWEFMGGSSQAGAPGVYGIKGVASAGSVPGARDGAVTWTDAAGNLWLFGGTFIDATGKLFYLNDLWQYAPSNGLWTWMSGSDSPSAMYGSPGSYGSKGGANRSNVPGARAGTVAWKDAAGNFWLFGGYGYDSSNVGYLNDLWKYEPATGEWTWVAGPDSSSPPSAVYGTRGVPAPGNLPGPRIGAVSWIDASGNLWLFGGNGDVSNASPYQIGYLNDLWEFSPASGQWTWVSGSDTVFAVGVYGTLGVAAAANVPPARAGGGSWIDASGSLWLFGGDSLPGFLNDLWKFTPSTNQWTWESGSSTPNAFGVYGTQSVAAAANVPGARAPAASWTDAAGNFWLFGGGGIVAPSTSGDFNDLWIFSPASGQWSWVSGSSSGTAGAVPASPMPGARAAAASWVDAAGNFWLFGGESPADPVAGGELNDLWEYRQAD